MANIRLHMQMQDFLHERVLAGNSRDSCELRCTGWARQHVQGIVAVMPGAQGPTAVAALATSQTGAPG